MEKDPKMFRFFLEKKKKSGGNTFPDVKDYYIAAIIKMVELSWDTHRDQWNRIANTEIDPQHMPNLL